MTHRLVPALVNGRSGDPALLLDLPQQGRAMLFDAGDLAALDGRALLRVTHLFLSHAHMDHLIGFDRLLRVNVGRQARIAMFGPPGTITRIGHKLRGYEWDLVDRIVPVLSFEVAELHAGDVLRGARFALQRGFEPEPLPETSASGGVLLDEPGIRVRAALLAHHGPVLGFRAEEGMQATVRAEAVVARGWRTGPWVTALKGAALAGAAEVETPGGRMPLSTLRDVVVTVPGRAIGYVTDVADTPANRLAIAALVQDVELLFIEAPFLAAEAERALERGHLTARAAGEIARAAGVGAVEPFHFSPRHIAAEVLAEIAAAFSPPGPAAPRPS
ncbi:MBL fold metallo-hydrolase [Plastoroseomonas hellenica]|uniref:MBL fold metallo-hydrolase n=1 Tax=Plastoroseomonas hellenica TaxID=2687306 RepID=UPI001BA9DC39|nr:MBL fold metallo-hydrolase [Plastoroseomonas hellenica]MBR0647166.1 ribonuclease Z [Plastoroseomonas hellenica]